MRLKKIEISNYKNLRGFKIDLQEDSFIDVIVGKNGSGKSNLFEALLEIFQHLFEDDYIIGFQYALTWELGDQMYSVKWNGAKWMNEDGTERNKPLPQVLPQNIIIYYSGHNNYIAEVLSKYQDLNRKKLDRNRRAVSFSSTSVRRIIGIGSQYKNLLIAVLLLQQDGLAARDFVMKKLGIASIDPEIKLVLKRPDYALGNNGIIFNEFSVEGSDDKRFWGAEGLFEEFLELLWNTETIANEKPRTEGYINPEDATTDQFIMYRSFEALRLKLKDVDPLLVFSSFDNLVAIGMLDSISFEVELDTGTKVSIDQFSDGQFQSVYIYAVTELFKEVNCITLLDEPDSFLHPEWQYEFLSQVFEITAESSESNHVLMTSHSAVTLIPHSKKKIRIFDVQDQKVINYEVPKHVAIKKLSSDVIRYAEHDQVLSIINTIQIENKPVLFTEGVTDPLIIQQAWKKLYEDLEMPFIPFYAFGHSYIANLLCDPTIHSEMNGKPIFGLFDFDQAYENYGSFSSNVVQGDPYNGLVKKHDTHNSYVMMLPVPKGSTIENQVINPDTGEDYGERSLMTIEHLFYETNGATDLFSVDASRPGEFVKFSGDKVKFAKEFVPVLSASEFEVFRPMFDFITTSI